MYYNTRHNVSYYLVVYKKMDNYTYIYIYI